MSSGGSVDAEGFSGRTPPGGDLNPGGKTPSEAKSYYLYGNSGQIVASLTFDPETGTYSSVDGMFPGTGMDGQVIQVRPLGTQGYFVGWGHTLLVSSDFPWPNGVRGQPEVACASGAGESFLLYFGTGMQLIAIVIGPQGTSSFSQFNLAASTQSGIVERAYFSPAWSAVVEGPLSSPVHTGQWGSAGGIQGASGDCFVNNPGTITGGGN